MSDVVERFTQRARVTMVWELDADYTTTDTGRVRCIGWLADPVGLLAKCRSEDAEIVTIERLSVEFASPSPARGTPGGTPDSSGPGVPPNHEGETR